MANEEPTGNHRQRRDSPVSDRLLRQEAAKDRKGGVAGWELYLVILLSSLVFVVAIVLAALAD